MDNFTKTIPPLTAEELAEIEALKNMRDEDIDYSDIPKITHEEWVTRFKPARLRREKFKDMAS